MYRLEEIILKNSSKHGHFEEYLKIIKIVRENINQNSDISIESCKSLVEGISKTIIFNLDKSYSKEKIDKYELQKLFKIAVQTLSSKCNDFEEDFVSRFSNIIQVLGEIRNKRGDISHGRLAPKVVNSSSKFASTVCYMTEAILYYVLEYYFALDLVCDSYLVYKDLKAYNNWLDGSVKFPIENVAYSKALFEYDYISYETRYNDEYLTRDEEINKEEKQLDGEETINQSIDKGEKAYNSCKDSEKHNESNSLSTIFDSATYWTENKRNLLISFSEDERLDFEGLKLAINDYKLTFYFKRDDLVQIMLKTPSLKERGKVVNDLEVKIKDLITKLDLE